MGWTILVFIPKVNTDTWGVGLLKTLWKFLEAIIDTYPWSRIQFHDFLHGFCAWRGTGTATMELNIAQYLSSINQYPLLLVFLDLTKAYDTVDRICLISTLEG